MSLQERHQAFLGVIETGGIPFDYYKPFAPPQFSCTQSVGLRDMGFRDASRGEVASDFLDNYQRLRPEVQRWGALQYVLRGRMRFVDHGKECWIESGNAVLFDVPSKTSYHDPEEPDAQWFFITFYGEAALGIVDEIVSRNGYIVRNLESCRFVPLAARLFSMASSHAGPNHFEYCVQLYSILMELASEVLSYRKTYPEQVAHALEIMDHHFGDSSLSLETLAMQVGLSKAYFARMFRDHIGESPTVYLQEKRMQTAMELLLRTHQPIKEIQYRCGFNSYSYFMTVFRKFYGMPPGAVRAQ
jgi:AraC-like DNA-binding protein